MKIDKAEEIIDKRYQNKMCSMEEKTNEGLVIHLGTQIDFTKEEEASVIILRELQTVRKKANKYDSLVEKIKEKIEELQKTKYDFDNSIRIYTLQDSIEFQASILQELLEEGEKE